MLNSPLKGAVVLVVSDALTSEQCVMRSLAAQGCTSERGEPGLLLDPSLRYDACVIDMHCHRGWGSGMILGLRTAGLPCASLMLLARGEASDVTAALGSGAVDCLVMPFAGEDLLDAVANAIHCTKRWRSRVSSLRLRELDEPVPPAARPIVSIPDFSRSTEADSEVVQARPREGSGPRIELIVRRLTESGRLTPRESEVLYWLLHGHRYDDIASVLGVSRRTTQFHAGNLLRKLELDSRFDLTRLIAEEH